MSNARQNSKIDGTTMAVLANRFGVISRAMAHTLMRTARSGVIATGRDFSTAIMTANGDLLSLNEGLPLHVNSADIQARSLNELQPVMKRGDAFLHNSPYHGNTHAADWTIFVPVVDDDGVHRLTCLAKAHMGDTGNSQPTTYFAEATDIYNEGSLIFPAVKAMENYEHNQDIINMCRMRIRAPDAWWGDYLAVVGAARTGERQIMAVGEEYGWDLIEDFITEWFDYSERRMSTVLKTLPSGKSVGVVTHDPFPGMKPEGYKITAKVEVDADQGTVEIDLTENADCMPNGMNQSEATAVAGAITSVMASVGAMDAETDIPQNSGAFRRIKVKLREGCAVGIPRHPTSCSAATISFCERLQNAVLRAFADLGDGIGQAEATTTLAPAAGVISGMDPRPGKGVFVNQIFYGYAGGPATPKSDGWVSYGNNSSAGGVTRDSVEISELQYPIRVLAQKFVPDTEGAGRFRGVPGVLCEYQAVDTTVTNYYSMDSAIYPAQGVRGGLAGAPSSCEVRKSNGEIVDAPNVGLYSLEAGDAMISIWGGSGGYGPPLERDPVRVQNDVKGQLITRERAENVYGVVLDDDLEIDAEKTAAKRQSLATA